MDWIAIRFLCWKMALPYGSSTIQEVRIGMQVSVVINAGPGVRQP